MTMSANAEHRFQLNATQWWMWRDGVLRSAGFPARGLDRLGAPELAQAADSYLAGATTAAAFHAEFANAAVVSGKELALIAADPRVREAATWSQSSAREVVESLLQDPPPGPRRRELEQQLGILWQRYCGMNDTIGFFGPFQWFTVDPDRSATTVVPGRALLGWRKVFLEPWAAAAYGSRLATNPALRAWLPPRRRTHHHVDGTTLRRPGASALSLSEHDAAILARCNGRRPAALIADELVALGVIPGADRAELLHRIGDLADRRLLTWDANVPIAPQAEEVLAERIAAIADEELRAEAMAGLQRLRIRRDAVACAAGDPNALATALAELDREFTQVCGRAPRRRGYTYPGHAVCFEDTLRMVRTAVGRDLLDAITPALAIALRAARWFTHELARRFEVELARLIAQRDPAEGPPTLADLWDTAVGLLFGPRDRGPVGEALDEFESRLRALLRLEPGVTEVTLTSEELQERAARLFGSPDVGWSWARVHSPDILVCAPSVEAINKGDFLAVLGELHIAMATHCSRTLAWARPNMLDHIHLAIRDYGMSRWLPLIPRVWVDFAGWPLQFDDEPTDRYLAFAPTSGVDADRTVATVAISIERTTDGVLVGRLPDATLVPLTELCAALLTMCAANGLRDAMRGPHLPRVTIDRLVVWRATWRLTPDEVGSLAGASDDVSGYLAARRLVSTRGLPRRCFARLSTQKKPFYVDFTSPVYVSALAASIRAGVEVDPELTVTLTEMLPQPDQTWLPDAAGDTYLCELRLQVTDVLA